MTNFFPINGDIDPTPDASKKASLEVQANLIGRVGLLTEKVSTLQELLLVQDAEKQSVIDQMVQKVQNLEVELHYSRHQHFLTARDTTPQPAVYELLESVDRVNNRSQWLLKLALLAGLLWTSPYLLTVLLKLLKNATNPL